MNSFKNDAFISEMDINENFQFDENLVYMLHNILTAKQIFQLREFSRIGMEEERSTPYYVKSSPYGI